MQKIKKEIVVLALIIVPVVIILWMAIKGKEIQFHDTYFEFWTFVYWTATVMVLITFSIRSFIQRYTNEYSNGILIVSLLFLITILFRIILFYYYDTGILLLKTMMLTMALTVYTLFVTLKTIHIVKGR